MLKHMSFVNMRCERSQRCAADPVGEVEEALSTWTLEIVREEQLDADHHRIDVTFGMWLEKQSSMVRSCSSKAVEQFHGDDDVVFKDVTLLKNHVRQVDNVDLEPNNGSRPRSKRSSTRLRCNMFENRGVGRRGFASRVGGEVGGRVVAKVGVAQGRGQQALGGCRGWFAQLAVENRANNTNEKEPHHP